MGAVRLRRRLPAGRGAVLGGGGSPGWERRALLRVLCSTRVCQSNKRNRDRLQWLLLCAAHHGALAGRDAAIPLSKMLSKISEAPENLYKRVEIPNFLKLLPETLK